MYYSPSTKTMPKEPAPGGAPKKKPDKKTKKIRLDILRLWRYIRSLGRTRRNGDLFYLLFCILTPLYMEFTVKIVNKTTFSVRIFFYVLLFSASWGIFTYLICRLFPKRNTRFGMTLIITAIETVLFSTEMILYQTFFKQYQGLGMIFDQAGDVATGFGTDTANSIAAYIFEVILLSLPIVVLLVFSRTIVRSARPKAPFRAVCLVSMLCCFGLATLLVYTDTDGMPSDRDYYTSSYTVTDAMKRFGILAGVRLDIKYTLFGNPAAKPSDLNDSNILMPEEPIGDTPDEPVKYAPNTLDIDFASRAASDTDEAIKELDEYFSSQTPSMKNEYTGMFEGKNCIFITAESFTPYFISPELTPTLYKMMTEGFVFNNYYQPAWGVSTSDGEYSGLMGLVPKGGINSMKRSQTNNLYTTLGNSFTRLGYYTAAYHANDYTYYDRDKTHMNLGYSTFIGYGNGIEVGVEKHWPQSDLEAMQTVIPWFIDKQPFHIYYMSVSGHPLYSFKGNYIAYKNKDLVADLPYSEPVKAYIACNLELEYAVTYLTEQLKAAGIADDTVIVINPDHYPYGLEEGFEGNTSDYISELAGHTVDSNFERHKNTLIIYCSDMKEPVVVDEPCYSLDILPTLSNLFGFEFDSRLYTGRDVMSDAVPLVLFRNYSWITDKGSYNSQTKEFIPNEGVTVDEDYVSQVSKAVRGKVYVAAQILETDYFNSLFGS